MQGHFTTVKFAWKLPTQELGDCAVTVHLHFLTHLAFAEPGQSTVAAVSVSAYLASASACKKKQ